jgi:hypothetical protein
MNKTFDLFFWKLYCCLYMILFISKGFTNWIETISSKILEKGTKLSKATEQ